MSGGRSSHLVALLLAGSAALACGAHQDALESPWVSAATACEQGQPFSEIEPVDVRTLVVTGPCPTYGRQELGWPMGDTSKGGAFSINVGYKPKALIVERNWARWVLIEVDETSTITVTVAVSSEGPGPDQDAEPSPIGLVLYRNPDEKRDLRNTTQVVLQARGTRCYRGPTSRCEIARVEPVGPGGSVEVTVSVDPGILYAEIRDLRPDPTYAAGLSPQIAARFHIMAD